MLIELSIEYTLEIDSFDTPNEVTGIKGSANLILNLIFLNPGTYPTAPEMGVGLQAYRFDMIDDEMVRRLETKIKDQIQVYLPELASVDIKLTKPKDDTLLLAIAIDNEVILANINTVNEQLQVQLAEYDMFRKNKE